MSKKRNKDPWNLFVSGLLKRKRANREYKLPKEYILSIADNIWRTNPSKDIIYNTLLEMSGIIYRKGFERKEDDIAFFKRKQKQHLDQEFGKFQDRLDDIIHCKNLKS
jgi:hypothetical protein